MSTSQSVNNLRSRLYKKNPTDSQIITRKGKIGSGLIPSITRKSQLTLKSKLPPITFDKGSIHLSSIFGKDISAISKRPGLGGFQSGTGMDSRFFKGPSSGQHGQSSTKDATNRSQILPQLFQNDKSLLLHSSPQNAHQHVANSSHKAEHHSKGYLTPLDFIQLVQDDPEMSDEFCYLRKRDSPYDWEIVQFDKIGKTDHKTGKASKMKLKEYMTISSRGITHFIDDEAYFISLEEWKREYKLYTELKKLKFFDYYKKWKNFNLWRKLRRRTEFKKRQQFLQENMFLIDENLSRPLLQIREVCCRIKNEHNIVRLPTKEVADIEDFREGQVNHIMEQKGVIDHQVNEKIKRILENSCKTSLSAFITENRIPNRNKEANDDEELDDDEEQRPPLLVGDESNKEMPYTQEATIRTHYKRLKKFIRLVDYLVLDGKLNLMSNSMVKTAEYMDINMEMLGSVIKTGGSLPTIINVRAFFEDKQIFYDPSLNYVQKTFDEVIVLGVQNICGDQAMLIKAPEFGTYVRKEERDEEEEEDEIDIFKLATSNPIFVRNKAHILDQLGNNFLQVEGKSTDLETILEIVTRAQDFSEHDIDGKTFEDIRELIETFMNDHETIGRLVERIDLGLYNFERGDLKTKFLNISMDCLETIKDYFPDMIEALFDAFTLRMKGMVEKLSGSTLEVAQFIEHLNNYEENKQAFEESNKEYSQLVSLNNIFNHEGFAIKKPESSKKSFDEFKNSKEEVKKLLEDIERKMDSDRNRSKKELTTLLPILEQNLKSLKSDIEEFDLNGEHHPTPAVEQIDEYLEQAEELLKTSKEYKMYQDRLNMDVTEIVQYVEFEKEIRNYSTFWHMKGDWLAQVEAYKASTVSGLHPEEMQKEMKRQLNTCYYLLKEVEGNKMFRAFLDTIKSFESAIVATRSLQEPALKQTDWIGIKKLLVEDEEDLPDPSLPEDEWVIPPEINFSLKAETFTLGKAFGLGLPPLCEEIQEIAVRASREEGLVEMLERIKIFLHDKCYIETESYKNYNDVFQLSANEELIKNLDANILLATNILSSKYVTRIRDQVNLEKKRLDYFQELLDDWFGCQRTWLYLEPIFNGDESNKELIHERKIFKKHVHNEFIGLTRECSVNFGNIRKKIISKDKKLLGKLKGINKELDLLEKKLISYLDSKRTNFPRFYFVSNDDLIDILAGGRSAERLQPHLSKLFEALKKLNGSSIDTAVEGFTSPEGEVVVFPPSGVIVVSSDTTVNELLTTLEKGMRENVKAFIKKAQEAMQKNPEERTSWLMEHPAQAVLVCDSIIWTKGVETSLDDEKDPLGELDLWCDTQYQELEEVIEMVRGSIRKDKRKLINALITQDVHYRDITEELGFGGVVSSKDFHWSKQLRFYYNFTSEVVGRQVQSQISYGYEYLGVPSKLAITPLTDRCWMTVTSALHIHLGCAPKGPAGTGKTESVKDLAKNMGIQCIVFNCSEQVTVGMMKSQFLGLIYTGAWLCLDEFNRIGIEVLSVIAQQILAMKIALSTNPNTFMFHGSLVNTEKFTGIGVFTTMNPGYAGRTELPDNLKVLFRPVSMMVPDYAIIAQILLFAEGFVAAPDLAKKLTKLYKLASEQLSQQHHYDFGMRAVKSILSMAGNLKRSRPTDDEHLLIIQAMQDVNLPKFLDDDIRLFNAIVQDLFPGMFLDKKNEEGVVEAIKAAARGQKLMEVPVFVEKCMQFHDIAKIRFGSMLVGPPMTGKTAVLNTVMHAYNSLAVLKAGGEFQLVKRVVMNPKSITMGELYGESDPITGDFRNGLASSFFAQYAEDTTETKKWIVFDGPVDSLWIENLNSVLDDSMTLCLSNGKRIKLKTDIRVFFEVKDLQQASPATVSRVGMVYLDDGVIPPIELAKSFMDKEFTNPVVLEEEEKKQDQQQFQSPEGEEGPEAESSGTNIARRPIDNSSLGGSKDRPLLLPEHRTYFLKKLKTMFPELIAGLRKRGREPIPTKDNSLMLSLLRILRSLYMEDLDPKKLTADNWEAVLSKILIFATTWSVCCTCDHLTTDKIEKTATNIFPLSDLPQGELGDSFLDFTLPSPNWQKWESLDLEFEYQPGTSYSDIIVPTQNTKRYEFLLRRAIQCKYPVYLTGVTGSGKTVIIKAVLNKMEAEGLILPLAMTFSAKTSASLVQNSIASKTNTLRKEEATPLGMKKKVFLIPKLPGKTLVAFIDDINMPEVEQYGAQPPIELLRQVVDSEGFFDRDLFQWRQLQDTVLLAASVNPGAGRAGVSERFTRHFQMINIQPSDDGVMLRIFGTLIKQFLEVHQFTEDIQKSADGLVGGTLRLYHRMIEEMLPTPSKSHYTFNLRDVSKVFKGMFRMTPEIFEDADKVRRLWMHEVERCFCDRLATREDRLQYFGYMSEVLGSYLSINTPPDDLVSQKLIFADFGNETTRELDEIPTLDKARKLIEMYMMRTNLRLELFADAVQHLCRIERILREDQNNVLLVGIGGSGKKSLTAVASEMAGAQLAQIEPSKDYGLPQFEDELFKKMLYPTGVAGQKVCFLFTDTHVLEESFLEVINNLINTGEVTISKENLETLSKDIKEEIAKSKFQGDEMEFYLQRVRSNLNIVLAMSPVGEALRTRIRNFPSFVNCCTINWVDTWPEEALRSISVKSLAQDMQPDTVGEVTDLVINVHGSAVQAAERFFAMYRRKVYITPKNYLDVLGLFQAFLKEFKGDIDDNIRKLTVGLTKLDESNQKVADLRTILEKMKPVLEEKTIAQNILLKELEKDRSAANIVKEKVEYEKSEVEEKAQEVELILSQAQDKVNEAKPKLEEAKKALNVLDRGKISEFKALKLEGAKKALMECILIIFGTAVSEGAMRQLATQNMFSSMVNKDPSDISKPNIKKLRKRIAGHPLLKNRDEDKAISDATFAGKFIFKWVLAIMDSSEIFEEVKVLKSEASKIKKIYDQQNAELMQKQAELDIVQAKVNKLTEDYQINQNQKKELEDKINKTNEKLENAEKLTSGLANESVRWKESLVTLNGKVKLVFGDSLLTACYVAYLGPFSGLPRKDLLILWKGYLQETGIAFSQDYKLEDLAVTVPQVGKWTVCGLPSNPTSICNGALVFRAASYPYMIDPQLQANKWIKNLEEERDLKVIKANDLDRMPAMVEAAIKLGKPVLIEDASENLPPFLDRLLLKQFEMEGSTKFVKIGDARVEMEEGFTLYFTSKLANPHFLPEGFIRVSVVNFTVTEDGLEEQLLAVLIGDIMPEKEEMRRSLIMSIAQGEAELRENEDTILSLLNDSGDKDLLENTPLILKLESSKLKNEEVKQSLEANEVAQKDIQSAREKYRSVAKRGSQLYFVVCDLADIESMYQFSLVYFVRLFQMTISTLKEALAQLKNEEERCEMLIEHITENIFLNICRGLFNDHKKIFAFLLSVKIEMGDRAISQAEWDLLLKGVPLGMEVEAPNLPSGLPFDKDSWKEFCYFLGLLDAPGKDFLNFLVKDVTFVKDITQWAETEFPYDESVPRGFEDKFSDFQKLLLVKAMRPDSTQISIHSFIETTLGSLYISNEVPSLEEVFRDCDHETPMIFVLSPGSDPLANVQKFAGYQEVKLNPISLGQGQGEVAKSMIDHARIQGEWVLLQNCHLSKSFMPELEAIIETFSKMTLLEVEELPEEQAPVEPQPQVDGQPQDPTSEGVVDPSPQLEDQNEPLQDTSFQSRRPTLDKEALRTSIHPDFRLLLTSTPCDYFPITILQNGVKLTNEPPKGIKANLLKTYYDFDGDILTSYKGSQGQTWRKLLYAYSLFHAVVLERRKFGSLGWNILYDFSDSDLETNVQMLKIMLQENQENTPFYSLQYLTSQINYGGRVTDEWDRRTLSTIFDLFVNEKSVNQEDYEFTNSEEFKMVQFPEMTDYIEYFKEEIPELDPPDIFGMDPKAEIAYQIKESSRMLKLVLDLQPQDVSAAPKPSPSNQPGDNTSTTSDQQYGETGEDGEEEQQPSNDGRVTEFINKLKKKQPEAILREGEKKPSITNFNDPLDVCVVQEVERFNNLIENMQNSLEMLLKAIRGEAVMNDGLESMFHSFLKNEVPQLWKDHAYPSLKPLLDWYTDFLERVDFFRQWYKSGNRPVSYKLNAFFFPQGFLTSVLQDHSRLENIPIDRLSFNFEFKGIDSASLTTSPETGCYIEGLVMEGACFDLTRMSLAATDPNGAMFVQAPMIHFIPTKDHTPDQEDYAMPLYKTLLRKGALSATGHSTNFVLTIYCPTKIEPVHWILNGAAFICA